MSAGEKRREQMHDAITLLVDTDELLRKKWSKLPSAEAAFRCEAKEQLANLGRSPLDGDVSVELDIYAPDQGQQPHIRAWSRPTLTLSKASLITPTVRSAI